MEEIKQEVEMKVQEKLPEFSFDVKENWRSFTCDEISDIQNIVDNAFETFRLLKRAGQFQEAALARQKCVDTMYSQMHMRMVMNMDFKKPRKKMMDVIKKTGVDINSPEIQNYFKKIQEQNLVDVRLMKEGKKPPT